MHLAVTVGVEQHTVVVAVWAAARAPDNVVAMPPRYRRDFLAADETAALLLLPEMEQLATSFKGSLHFHIKSMFKVGFPIRVKRVCRLADFAVPLDGHVARVEQGDPFSP